MTGTQRETSISASFPELSSLELLPVPSKGGSLQTSTTWNWPVSISNCIYSKIANINNLPQNWPVSIKNCYPSKIVIIKTKYLPQNWPVSISNYNPSEIANAGWLQISINYLIKARYLAYRMYKKNGLQVCIWEWSDVYSDANMSIVMPTCL